LADIMKNVSQTRTVEIQLLGGEQTIKAFAALKEMLPAESSLSKSDAESVVRFQSDHSEAEMADLLKQLVQRDVGVSQFRELQTDLEDAFLSVTKASTSGGVASK